MAKTEPTPAQGNGARSSKPTRAGLVETAKNHLRTRLKRQILALTVKKRKKTMLDMWMTRKRRKRRNKKKKLTSSAS